MSGKAKVPPGANWLGVRILDIECKADGWHALVELFALTDEGREICRYTEQWVKVDGPPFGDVLAFRPGFLKVFVGHPRPGDKKGE